MEIKKILVPVDFSKCSINALKIATDIAKGQKAEIEIINAIHVPAHPHADLAAAGAFVGPILSEYEEKVQGQLDELIFDVPELKNVHFTTKKYVSITTDAIRDCLGKDNIDLIVMGTKGSHDKLEKLLGSISNEVIRFSNIPVIMIPESASSFDIKRIGFAADLQEIKNIKKLEFLRFIAKISGSEIKIFHISQQDDIKHLDETNREKMKLLDFFSDVKHSYVWVNQEKTLEGMFDFTNSHQLDMLAMYPRQHDLWDRLFHTSVTKKVAQEIKIPLLTLHE